MSPLQHQILSLELLIPGRAAVIQFITCPASPDDVCGLMGDLADSWAAAAARVALVSDVAGPSPEGTYEPVVVRLAALLNIHVTVVIEGA